MGNYSQETLDTVSEAQWLTQDLRTFRQMAGWYLDNPEGALRDKQLRTVLESIYSRQDTLDDLLIERRQINQLVDIWIDHDVEHADNTFQCYAQAARDSANVICMMLHISRPWAIGQRPSEARRGTKSPYPPMHVRNAILTHWDCMANDPLTESKALQKLQVKLSTEYRKVELKIQAVNGPTHREPPKELLLTSTPAINQNSDEAPGIAGKCRHSEDFANVIWYGTTYIFNDRQAECVKVLWKALKASTPVLYWKTIVDKANVVLDRTGRTIEVLSFDPVFRTSKGQHPAWKTMIVRDSKGKFCLKGKPEDLAE